MEDYIKYLHSKLYMIECMARKRIEDKDWKKVHDICCASPSQYDELLMKIRELH